MQLPRRHLVKQRSRAPGRSCHNVEKKKKWAKEMLFFAIGQCLQMAAFVAAVMLFHPPHVCSYRSEADADIPYST